MLGGKGGADADLDVGAVQVEEIDALCLEVCQGRLRLVQHALLRPTHRRSAPPADSRVRSTRLTSTLLRDLCGSWPLLHLVWMEILARSSGSAAKIEPSTFSVSQFWYCAHAAAT